MVYFFVFGISAKDQQGVLETLGKVTLLLSNSSTSHEQYHTA